MIPWRRFNPDDPAGINNGVFCLWAIAIWTNNGKKRSYRYVLGAWMRSASFGCVVMQPSGSIVVIPIYAWWALLNDPVPTIPIDNTIDVDAIISTPPPPALPPAPTISLP